MKRILVVALASVLCLALAGAAMASEAEGYTVGDFAVNLAKMVTSKADYTPEQAAAYLEKVGVECVIRLRKDYSAGTRTPVDDYVEFFFKHLGGEDP